MKLIMSTCPEKEADELAGKLLEERLVACVNIIPGIFSKYWWKGEQVAEEEALLIMKTRSGLVDRLIDRIKGLHSYEVPEVIVLDIKHGNPDYFKWIEEVTG